MMAFEDFIKANPYRQYVIDYLKENSWYSGDLPLVRKVTSSIWDELHYIRNIHQKEAEEVGWEKVKLALAEAWRRDLSALKDLSSVQKGELTGLSPDVLEIVKAVFPNISHYSLPSGATPRAENRQVDGAGKTEERDATEIVPEIPKRRSNGAKVAGIALIAVIFAAAALAITGGSPLAFFIPPSPANSTPDTTPPVISGAFPSNGSHAMIGSKVIVSYYDDRSLNLSSALLEIDGSRVAITKITQSEAEYAGSLAVGQHSAYFSISDMAGHSANKSWQFTISSALQYVVLNVLDEINRERASVGVPPVALSEQSVAADYRSNDMLTGNYFNHYDWGGYYPGYYYTLMGGKFAMEENIGYVYNSQLRQSEIPADAVSLVHDMIYNDAASDWGHRDSLLDPTNNLAEISAAWSSSRLFLTIHMIKSWVNWTAPPRFEGGVFSCGGALLLNGSMIKYGAVYYSDPDDHDQMSYDSYLEVYKGERGYSMGDPVAGVHPILLFQGLSVIRPTAWTDAGSGFSISFPLSASRGAGVYTVVLYAQNTLGFEHPYDPERNAELVPILEYSVYLG